MIGDSDNDLIKISALEMQWYMKNQLLRDSDWASMAHSLELRVPFVDIKFISKILSLQHSGLKLDKDYLKNHFKSNFPKYLISKSKTGFSTPVNDWLSKKMINVKRKNINQMHSTTTWASQVINHFL